jgi:iron complex outermembrane receptor protein
MNGSQGDLRNLICLILGGALATAANNAQAAIPEAGKVSTLQEVVVTATKREESVQNIAMAVTALRSEFRDRLKMDNIQDIANFTPGLTARDEPDERLNIRGVGRTTNAPGSDPGVGIYVDGVYTSSTRGIGDSTLMVDRIEVLRGPQGTLYGRNTIGGAVNVISKRPTPDWTGEARASYGNYNATMYGASVAGPLSDNVGVRFDAVKQDRDGYIKNLGPGNDLADLDSFDASAQVNWRITDKLNLWVRTIYNNYDNAPDFRVLREQWRNDVFFEGLVVHPWYGYTEVNPAIENPWRIRQNENQSLSNQKNAVLAQLSYEAEGFTVKYIGGYNDWDWKMHYDGDGIAQTQPVNFVDLWGNPWSVPVAGTVDTSEVKHFTSHEIQFLSNSDGRLDWVTGLYFYSESTYGDWDWRTPGNQWLMNAYVDGTQTNWWETGQSLPNPEARGWYQGGRLDADSYAGYGQIGYDINDRWKINAGLRYSEDKKKGSEFQQWWWMPQSWWLGPNGTLYSLWNPATGQWEAASITGGFNTDTHKADWSAVTGLLSFEYRPSDRTLWYLSVSQGNKSGGFLLGALADRSSTPQDDGEVKPEDLTAYEIGYKADLTDNFRLNAAAYWYDYKNMQTQVWVKRGSLSFLELRNAYRARAYGLELEALWRIGNNTTVNAALSMARSKLTDFCGPDFEVNTDGSTGCLVNWQQPGIAYDPSGHVIPQSPRTQAAMNISHDVPLANGGTINLNGTYAYVGEINYSLLFSDESRAPHSDRVDLVASYRSPKSNYEVLLYAKNAFNSDRPTVVGEDGPQYGPIKWAYYSYPRLVGVEMRFNW